MATMGVGASGRGDWRVGVDLGGTQLRAAAVSADGQILSHDRRPTPGTSAADVVQAIVEALTIVEAGAATTSLASAASNPLVIAAPGPLDLATGRILDTPNLPHLRNFPLAAAVAEALHREVHLENDATLAALGEATFGAGRGFDVVLFLTISTGIGGGLVVDGRPYRGTSGQAAELGHLIIDGRRDAPAAGPGTPAASRRWRAGARSGGRRRRRERRAGATALTATSRIAAVVGRRRGMWPRPRAPAIPSRSRSWTMPLVGSASGSAVRSTHSIRPSWCSAAG
ncbi:MAG: ROK family protein [Ardenticatenales bacterium]|nr:ROK family protein [Ardenticatenales bacterium]